MPLGDLADAMGGQLSNTEHGPIGVVSLVTPTLDEADSLPRLVDDLDQLLANNPALRVKDLVVVDDGSTDGTRQILQRMASAPHPFLLRAVLRDAPQGSANAELEGFRQAGGEFVVKLDADGQHPTAVLGEMLRALQGDVDVVVASRYIDGGGTDWSAVRGVISRTACIIAHIMIPKSRELRDPISGFFVARRSLVVGLDPTVSRYKLLLHILVANPNLRVKEIPFRMLDRSAGQSKIVGASFDYMVNFGIELLKCWKLGQGRRSARGGLSR